MNPAIHSAGFAPAAAGERGSLERFIAERFRLVYGVMGGPIAACLRAALSA